MVHHSSLRTVIARRAQAIGILFEFRGNFFGKVVVRWYGKRYTSRQFSFDKGTLTLTEVGLMKFSGKRIMSVTALFVAFAVTQVYLGIAFAATNPNPPSVAIPAGPPQATAILTTQGNKPILINGASASTGATILSGATIETPDGVSATVNIPGHGSVEIAANSKVILEFDPTGNLKVTHIQGCLTLHTNSGTGGEVDNAQGIMGKTDRTKNDVLNICPGVKVAGAAAQAGLSTGAKVAIAAAIGGGVTALAFGLRGSNPSPSTP